MNQVMTPAHKAPMLHIGDFEGPIELLLRFVEQRKLPINDISLAQVADEYIAHLQSLPKMEYGMATHFISIATTLLIVKAKSLLPTLELAEEEERGIEDLERQLKWYQIFRDAGKLLADTAGKHRMYARPFKLKREIIFTPDPTTMTLENMEGILNDLLGGLKKIQKETLPEARIRIVVHIEDVMSSLRTRLATAVSVSFREMTKNLVPGDAISYETHKSSTIVSFLAVLELARHGMIAILQDEVYGDMTLTKGEGIPDSE